MKPSERKEILPKTGRNAAGVKGGREVQGVTKKTENFPQTFNRFGLNGV